LMAQALESAGHLAIAAEEARRVRLLERGEPGERALIQAESGRSPARQERLEEREQLLGRTKALFFSLLQAAVGHGAGRAHVRALLAQARHGLIEGCDLRKARWRRLGQGDGCAVEALVAWRIEMRAFQCPMLGVAKRDNVKRRRALQGVLPGAQL